eukprot:TRINITY_DN9677_c0_g1_i1.p1 TRINITY_DN9677_c0_g1~~TRINITY_DN9677_c0_g1_i1.p1  ORF type:complete len:783 (-),score=145.05 TRINITY_DN9677_c0_g1_i1:471-2819(-)
MTTGTISPVPLPTPALCWPASSSSWRVLSRGGAVVSNGVCGSPGGVATMPAPPLMELENSLARESPQMIARGIAERYVAGLINGCMDLVAIFDTSVMGPEASVTSPVTEPSAKELKAARAAFVVENASREAIEMKLRAARTTAATMREGRCAASGRNSRSAGVYGSDALSPVPESCTPEAPPNLHVLNLPDGCRRGPDQGRPEAHRSSGKKRLEALVSGMPTPWFACADSETVRLRRLIDPRYRRRSYLKNKHGEWRRELPLHKKRQLIGLTSQSLAQEETAARKRGSGSRKASTWPASGPSEPQLGREESPVHGETTCSQARLFSQSFSLAEREGNVCGADGGGGSSRGDGTPTPRGARVRGSVAAISRATNGTAGKPADASPQDGVVVRKDTGGSFASAMTESFPSANGPSPSRRTATNMKLQVQSPKVAVFRHSPTCRLPPPPLPQAKRRPQSSYLARALRERAFRSGETSASEGNQDCPVDEEEKLELAEIDLLHDFKQRFCDIKKTNGQNQVSNIEMDMWELHQTAEALKMSVDDVLLVKSIYEQFDADRSGALNIDEFEAAVVQLLRHQLHDDSISIERVHSILGCCYTDGDSEHSGAMDFKEFLKWYSSNGFNEELLLSENQRWLRHVAKQNKMNLEYVECIKRWFDTYDTDSSGFIDIEEFKQVLCKLLKVPANMEFPHSRIRYFWSEIDTDGSGKAMFEVFLQWYHRYFKDDQSNFEKIAPFCDIYKKVRRIGGKFLDPPAYPPETDKPSPFQNGEIDFVTAFCRESGVNVDV